MKKFLYCVKWVMKRAWQMVKNNGFSLSDALKLAWQEEKDAVFFANQGIEYVVFVGFDGKASKFYLPSLIKMGVEIGDLENLVEIRELISDGIYSFVYANGEKKKFILNFGVFSEAEEKKPEYKTVKNTRVGSIIWENAEYYIDNGCDKKEYVKNGISYIEITLSNYIDYVLNDLKTRELDIKNTVKIYGEESQFTKEEKQVYDLYIKSVNKIKIIDAEKYKYTLVPKYSHLLGYKFKVKKDLSTKEIIAVCVKNSLSYAEMRFMFDVKELA